MSEAAIINRLSQQPLAKIRETAALRLGELVKLVS
jgi:hypothetical protein